MLSGNIQLKIDAAAGAATALEMRLRIVAELLQELESWLLMQVDPQVEFLGSPKHVVLN